MTVTSDVTPDITALLATMRRAGRDVAAYQRSAARTVVARDTKRDRHDIVTEHDRNCEEISTAVLRDVFPDCRIVGEEKGLREGSSGVTFYIDPIDGTSNFVAGMPLFAVSIGATVDDDLVAGVVHAPLLGHEFYACRGGGAWVESFDADGPVRLGEPVLRGTADCVLLTGFPNARERRRWGDGGAAVAGNLAQGVMAVRNLGSTALELAFVAAGWVDCAYGTGAGPWDIAGGLALVNEAGGASWHRALLGATGALPWEQPGYAVAGPGRTIPELEHTLDALDGIARSIG